MKLSPDRKGEDVPGENQLLAELKAIQQRQARQGVVGVVLYPAAHCMYLPRSMWKGQFRYALLKKDIQDFDQVLEGLDVIFGF